MFFKLDSGWRGKVNEKKKENIVCDTVYLPPNSHAKEAKYCSPKPRSKEW